MTKKLKEIELEVKEVAGRFIRLCEARVTHTYDDGTVSGPGRNEFIHRNGFDSVAVAIFSEKERRFRVALRGQIRIPVLSRKGSERVRADDPELFLLEAVAGSLEPGEDGKKAAARRAASEVFEEAGFMVKRGDIFSLGAPFYSSPGQSSEKIFPYAVKVEVGEGREPEGDGSLFEKDLPPLEFHPLEKIIDMARRGKIMDAKTEIVAMRLAIHLGVLSIKPVRKPAMKKRGGIRPRD